MAGEQEVHSVVRTRTSAKTILFRIVVVIILVTAAAAGYLYWKDSQRFETTDDAQVDGQIYTISSRVTGHVLEVAVEDEQTVKAGDVLVKLDPKDFQIALEKAKADLADAVASLNSTRRDVPILAATTSSTLLSARSAKADAEAAMAGAERQLSAARARLETAEANLRVAVANDTRAAQDVARYQALVDKDEISKQVYDQAVSAEAAARATVDAQKAQVQEARDNVSAAEKRVAQAEAQIQAAMTGPQQVKAQEARAQAAAAKVEQCKTAVEQAELNLQYTTIYAPVSGVVGKKNVEPGNNVSAGQQLMAVVPLDDVWITANFKETQLRRMKPGQPVTIKVDAYDREYKGHVLRFAGASGARMSLLPPENATGNFVKVVQRIPVRIGLDPGQNEDHLLRPGMSVVPAVEVR